MIKWFKKIKKEIYINKVYKNEGHKGVQELINLSMRKMQEDPKNNISRDEVVEISKMLSKAMVD